MVMKETLYSIPEGHDALILKQRAVTAQRQGGIAVHILSDDQRMAALQDHLAFFAPEIAVLTLPAWDCLPYDRVSPNTVIMGERVRTLHALTQRLDSEICQATILLTTQAAVTQKLPPPSAMRNSYRSVQAGGRYDPDDLCAFLSAQGYNRVQTVREQGEFALRGGLMDVWPAGHDIPARMDFFGDELESLKSFDPLTQLSGDAMPGLEMLQLGEVVMNEDAINRFRNGFRAHFGAMVASHPIYESVSQGRRIAGVEHYLPLFYPEMVGLDAYCPNALISIEESARQAATQRLELVNDYFETRQSLDQQAVRAKTSLYYPLPPEALYFSVDQWEEQLANITCFNPYDTPDAVGAANAQARYGRDFADIRHMPDGNLWNALQDYMTQNGHGKFAVLALYGHGARERVKAMFEAQRDNPNNLPQPLMRLRMCERLADIRKLKNNEIGLTVLPLVRGFINDEYLIVSEQDLLGDRLTRRADQRKVKKQADAFIQDISALNEGDLIVHDDHGVGRFDGLETVSAAGILHDCLRMTYDGGDRLFVPVENIETLSRFGGEEGTVALDKLGGAGWQARKAKVKKDLLVIAGQLLDIAAARTMKKANIYNPDAAQLAAFASGFPYAETQDQMDSITAVLADLQAGRPMDRLVCGDVGFGKTEVALRAAHAVAHEGAQVAVIVPTTLLARQHAAQFEARFQGSGLRVAQLSRLVTPKQANEAKQGLKRGAVDIVIGTHALLSEQIDFANLGLVIVDEEQRFGVKQKERLKRLKDNVHVLTLTATPIPRTLQMALTGVRDLSLITTPPVDRLAIRTFVMPFDPFVVREALLREHHRGGQSFVVCPRIKDLEDMQQRLSDNIPELRVIAAHGQLSTQDLENRMQAFIDREVDVLLATNIIESGLDIPAANTMIVHRADMFGLSQLYQIRGRIGRGKTRAYAYLTYESERKINDTALKRLDVMGTLDQLGSGFQLASHDMDIRGAGNLLGEQQSGHIREVGVELYQQMLEEAVAQVREGSESESENEEEQFIPQINLGTSVLIPETYVEDLQVRLNLYRRIGALVDEDDVEALAAELIDRFGAIPDEVENLLSITSMKYLCRKAGVGSIEAGPKGLVLGFHNDCPPSPEAIVQYVAQKSGTLKLRPDHKLAYIRQWTSRTQRINGTRQILQELAAL